MGTAAIATQIFQTLGSGQTTPEQHKFVAVPGGAKARWLFPAKSPEIRRVLRSWTPYRRWSRVAWAAVRAANQLGRVADMPGVSLLEIEELEGAKWAELGWRWGDRPIPVIYLGTPGPRRKAVVHLVERESARCKAVVKLPLTDEARAGVLHEADVLSALETQPCEFAPRVLHIDREQAITTQTFVEGRPGNRHFAPKFWRLLHSLLLPGETTSLRVHADQWECEMQDSAESAIALETIRQLRDDTPLVACWEHGDFMPWNLRLLNGAQCALLDWEDGKRNGLPMMDAYHFLHMQDFLFGGRPRLHAGDMQDGALGMGVAAKLARKLEMAYLVRTLMLSVKRDCGARARFVNRTLELCRRRAG